MDQERTSEPVKAGGVFERLLAPLLTRPSTSTPNLRFLAGMRPTEETEAEIADWRERPDSAKRTATLAMLEGHLVMARQRDEIQAGRPPGCWCVGYGSRGSLSGRVEYCPCPDGEQAKAKADRERREALQRRLAEQWRLASVPARFTEYTLDNFPVSERSQKAYDRVKWWSQGPDFGDDCDTEPPGVEEWVNRNTSLLLHGAFGTGKTGLGVGVLREQIEVEGSGLFVTVPNLLDRIRATYDGKGSDDEKELIRRVQTVGVLMLDDLGAERVTEWVAEKLFTVVNTRHDEMRPTIFTSNLDPKQLAGHVGERTAWRIVEMCEVVKLDGPNLRDRRR